MGLGTLGGMVHFVNQGISLTATSSPKIAPSFASTKKFVVDRIQVVIVTKSGTLSVAPTFSIGTDGPITNLVASSSSNITTAATADDVFSMTLVLPHTGTRTLAVDLSTSNGAGGGMLLNITAAATGSSLVLTCDVHVTGYFV